MPMMLGVCFLCPSMDCLWHKYHYCPQCHQKVVLLVYIIILDRTRKPEKIILIRRELLHGKYIKVYDSLCNIDILDMCGIEMLATHIWTHSLLLVKIHMCPTKSYGTRINLVVLMWVLTNQRESVEKCVLLAFLLVSDMYDMSYIDTGTDSCYI